MRLRWVIVCLGMAALAGGCNDASKGTGGVAGTDGAITDTSGGDSTGTSDVADTAGAPEDGTVADTGPGPDGAVADVSDTGSGPGDTVDGSSGPDDATDAGPEDAGADVTDAAPGPDAGDAGAIDAGPEDTGSSCAADPTCTCVIDECAAGLGLPTETACGALGQNEACLGKLFALYQTGGCGAACGGISKSMWGAICDDADCAGIKTLLQQAGPLTTQCEDCACTPDCAGKTCGDDGCGGSCGACEAGKTCDAGACVATTMEPTTCSEVHGVIGCCTNGDVYWFENGGLQGGAGSCTDTTCGWDAANGFYACNFEGADPSGTYPIACFGENPSPDTCPVCSCAGKVCGDDGCGGSCGTCGADQKCSAAGQCVEKGALVCVAPDGCTDADPCTCVSCTTDSQCTLDDDCICPDCAADSFCSDPNNCNGDGQCDMFNEGCVCADCAAHPSCNPVP